MRILLLCTLLGLFSSAPAQTDLETERQAIRDMLISQQTAWNRGDLEGFMKGYWHSDSLIFVGSKGPTYGWRSTLENYKKSYPDQQAMGKLTFGIIRLEFLSPRVASMVGRWQLDRQSGKTGGYFTLLWRKLENRWVIVQDHSS